MRKHIVNLGRNALKVLDKLGAASGADIIERGQVEMRLMNRIFQPAHSMLTGVRKPMAWAYNTTLAAQQWLDGLHDEILGEEPEEDALCPDCGAMNDAAAWSCANCEQIL